MSIRAAVIGVGYLGRFHAQKYKSIPQVELVAVSDLRAETANAVGKELGVESTTDFRSLASKIDIATIATTTRQHFEVAEWCLSHGISVLLEKPMTAEMWQAEELCRLAKQKDLLFQIGLVERFNQTYLKAKEYIPKPTMINVQRLHPYTKRGADVDVVLDLMIHDLDMVLSWAQSPLRSLQAVGEKVVSSTNDVVEARIEFESGLVAHVSAGRTAQSVTRKVRAWAPGKYVTADLAQNKVQFADKLNNDGKLEASEVSQFEKGDSLLLETRSFVDAYQNKKAAIVSGEDGLKVQKLCEQIMGAASRSPS